MRLGEKKNYIRYSQNIIERNKPLNAPNVSNMVTHLTVNKKPLNVTLYESLSLIWTDQILEQIQLDCPHCNFEQLC